MSPSNQPTSTQIAKKITLLFGLLKKSDDLQVLFEEIKMHPASLFVPVGYVCSKNISTYTIAPFSLGSSQSHFKVSV